jgi:tetratricopeptide (TPR) repeat protein
MATAAMGQTRQESFDKCQSVDPDAKIIGCTALLKADQDTNKNRAVIYRNRGAGYYNKGDYDGAIQDFNEAIRLNPNNANNYNNRGVAYKRKGHYDRAIQDYNQAIHLNSNDTIAYFNRGDAYFAQASLFPGIDGSAQSLATEIEIWGGFDDQRVLLDGTYNEYF